jgi:hypothetical protein
VVFWVVIPHSPLCEYLCLTVGVGQRWVSLYGQSDRNCCHSEPWEERGQKPLSVHTCCFIQVYFITYIKGTTHILLNVFENRVLSRMSGPKTGCNKRM